MDKKMLKKKIMVNSVVGVALAAVLAGTPLFVHAEAADGHALVAEQQAAGLVFRNGIPYVYDYNGTLVRNATPVINGKKYYVDGNGIAQSGWLRLADWQMYFDPYTYEAKIGIAKINGKAYLFDENGVEVLRSRTEVVNGKKYWFQPDGSLMSGWCQLGDWTMYYDPTTYVGAVGLTRINGQYYVFDENGVLLRNSTPVVWGKKYYTNGSGVAQSGWLRLANWQMYFNPSTYEAAIGITKIGGKAYLFDENGVEILTSRTENINGKKYWFQPDGSLMSGWCRLGNWLMYFDPITYEAAVGQRVIDGVSYTFDQNGVLQLDVEKYASTFEMLASCREVFGSSQELMNELETFVYRRFYNDRSYPRIIQDYGEYAAVPERDVLSYINNLFGLGLTKFQLSSDSFNYGAGIQYQNGQYIIGGGDPVDLRMYQFAGWYPSSTSGYDVVVNVIEADYSCRERFIIHIEAMNTTYGFVVDRISMVYN